MVTKGGDKKKSSRYVSTLPPFEFNQPTILELGFQAPEFIKCRICSTSVSSPLNFEWPAVPTDVTLAMIREAITKRHGGTARDIVLYKDHVKPECRLQDEDETASLKTLGIRGIVSGTQDELPLVTILYDFRAGGRDDPIILIDDNTLPSRFDLDLKLHASLTRQRGQR